MNEYYNITILQYYNITHKTSPLSGFIFLQKKKLSVSVKEKLCESVALGPTAINNHGKRSFHQSWTENYAFGYVVLHAKQTQIDS